MNDVQNIEKLMAEYLEATNEYEDSHTKAIAASMAETRALKRLSDAQKAIDKWHNDVKQDAPWSSSWSRV